MHLLRRAASLAAGPQHRAVSGRHARSLLGGEESLLDQPLDDPVEQLPQLPLDLPVPRFVPAGLASEEADHVGGELAGLHQGVEDRLAQSVHRPVATFRRLRPPGPVLWPAGEPGLQ